MSFDQTFEDMDKKIESLKSLLDIVVKHLQIFNVAENEKLEEHSKDEYACRYMPPKNPINLLRGIKGTIFQNDIPIQTFKMDELKQFSFSSRLSHSTNYVTSGSINYENTICLTWNKKPNSSYILVTYEYPK